MRNRAETILFWLLAIHGAGALCAVFAVFMPAAWMGTVHDEWLGMGELPMTPVVEYLARTVSIFYALFGALSLFAAVHVKDSPCIVAFLGWAAVLVGALVTGVILAAGLPWWWAAGEGLASVGVGVTVLVLKKLADKAPQG